MPSRLSTLTLALALAIAMTATGALAQTTTAPEPTTTEPAMSEPEEGAEEPADDVIEIDLDRAERQERRAARRRRQRRAAGSDPGRAGRRTSDTRSKSRKRSGKRRARHRKRAKSRLSAAQRRRRARARLVRRRALASVGRGDYVFPVFASASFSNDYGAWRASIGRGHEGNDIFAPFGAPVLAVADGTLFKVGTLPISGNRLWLLDGRGHTFFYAHLSAFSHRAVNDVVVRQGEVLGFIGATGDAKHTPPHLHFEVHPADGKPTNPYRHLLRWPRAAPRRAPGLAGSRERVPPPPGLLVEVRDLIAEQ